MSSGSDHEMCGGERLFWNCNVEERRSVERCALHVEEGFPHHDLS